MIPAEALYPIRELSRLTGIPSVTLRAWERRYGLFSPARTPAGHRLYSDADIELVMRIKALLHDGHSIGEVASRLANPVEQPRGLAALSPVAQAMLTAVAGFSRAGLEAAYVTALAGHDEKVVFREVILPVLTELGQRWLADDLGIAEEHFFTAWLHNHLAGRLAANEKAAGPTIVCACLPGNSHDIGLLIFALLAQRRGYQVIYLGANMPLSPLPRVIERAAARALILASGPRDEDDIQLYRLQEFLPTCQVPVLVGGPFAQRQIEVLRDLGCLPVGEDMALAMHLLGREVPCRP